MRQKDPNYSPGMVRSFEVEKHLLQFPALQSKSNA